MKDKHLLDIINKQSDILVLSSGYLEDDSPYYAYILMPPLKFLEYHNVKEKGGFNLEDFGKVVKWGNELGPSEEVKKDMRDKYNASENFEEDLAIAIKTILKEK